MPDKPTEEFPAREELIQRIQAALEDAPYYMLRAIIRLLAK